VLIGIGALIGKLEFRRKKETTGSKNKLINKSTIMNELMNKTLSQIVTENYQAARVFEKYGLDFCCKGKRPLKDACTEKQIAQNLILDDLNEALSLRTSTQEFNKMSLTELSEYIVRVHHGFCKDNMPIILGYAMRVAGKHGDNFPYMVEVCNLFAKLKQEMDQHMMKEERILFPRIKQLEQPETPNHGVEFLQAPIDVMEQEHDHAGDIMRRISELTNGYTPHEMACTTHRLLIDSLKAFEQDLHQHVHLENNILFPNAIALFIKSNVGATA
jgi:regulator of cell morphogenesis and NO signaling